MIAQPLVFRLSILFVSSASIHGSFTIVLLKLLHIEP